MHSEPFMLILYTSHLQKKTRTFKRRKSGINVKIILVWPKPMKSYELSAEEITSEMYIILCIFCVKALIKMMK